MAAEIGELTGFAAALGKGERRCWSGRIEGGKLAERRLLGRTERDDRRFCRLAAPERDEQQRERRHREDESENERGPEHFRRHGRPSPMSDAPGKHGAAPANT